MLNKDWLKLIFPGDNVEYKIAEHSRRQTADN